MTNIEIRPVQNRRELEAVYNLLDQSFSVGRTYFSSRLEHDRNYRWDTTWIALVDGIVASTLQVFPYICRVEDISLKVAGIGSVATDTRFRRQGLGLQLLRKSEQWLKREGYDLSLLFASLYPFYEKAGYSITTETEYALSSKQLITGVHLNTFLQPTVESSIDVDRLIKENTTDLQLSSKANHSYTVTRFNPDEHLTQVAQIYDILNHDRTLTRIRPDSYWQDMLNWTEWKDSCWFVAVKENTVCGYARMGLINNVQRSAAIEEIGFLPGYEAAVSPLLVHLLEAQTNIEHISIKLPKDHFLIPNLQRWGATERQDHSFMWKIIRLQDTLQLLKPVLERRLKREQTPNFRFALNCAGQSVLLIYDEGHLAISRTVEADEAMAISLLQPEFISMLFHGFEEQLISQRTVPIHSSHLPVVSLLQTLFPSQASIFYGTDKF